MFMLTIYENYYKNNEGHPFCKLRKLIPLMIMFYKTISYSELDEIRNVWRYESRLMKKIFNIKGYNRKEFIDHYQRMKKEYEDLYEFLDIQKFVN